MGKAHYLSLQQSKVVLLTGAGASAPFGMPTMDKFAELIDPNWHDMAMQIISRHPRHENDLEFLLGRLSLYETIQSEHASDTNLRNWISFLGYEACQKAPALKQHIFGRIVRRYGKLSTENRKKAASIYQELLQGLLSVTANDPPTLPIFTTNYDLVFEAVRDANPFLSFCNGLKTTQEESMWRPEHYSQSDYQFAIFRVHGCSHWMKDKRTDEIFFQAIPDTEGTEFREPCVLYPLPGKENRLDEEPFRTPYRLLDVCLKTAQTIILIGYSGRDPRIQASLLEALGLDPSKLLIVVTGSDQLRPELQVLKTRTNQFEHLGKGIETNVEEILKLCGAKKSLRFTDTINMPDGAAN